MTFKEFMHTPNPYLDNLAIEAEAQRTINEEAAYDSKHTETKKEIKRMRHYIITISKDNKVIANCRIEAANKAGAAALVTECKFAEAGYKAIVFAVNYLHVYNPVPDIAIYDRSGVCRSFSCSGHQDDEDYFRWILSHSTN